jgi:hypothetical protein
VLLPFVVRYFASFLVYHHHRVSTWDFDS